MTFFKKIFFCSIILISFINPLPAEGFSIDANKFKSSPFDDGFFTVYSGKGLDKNIFGMNFLMHYQPESISTLNSEGKKISSVINNQFTGDLSFFYSFIKWIDLGFVLPVIIYQDGDGWNKEDKLPSGGIGDIRIVPRFQVANISKDLFAISLIPEFTIPTGKLVHSAMGNSVFTFKPSLSFSTDTKWVGFATNFFYHILRKQTFAKSVFDDEFGAKIALNIHAVKEVLDIVAEFNANSSVSDPFKNESVDNIELGGGFKIKTPFNIDFSAGAFGGFGNAVGVPSYRIFFGISWKINTSSDKKPAIEKKDAPSPQPETKKEQKAEQISEPEVKKTDKTQQKSENEKLPKVIQEPEPEPKLQKKIEPDTKPVVKQSKMPAAKPQPRRNVLPKHVEKTGERLSTVVYFMQESDYINDPVQIEKIAMILIRNYTLNVRIEAHNDISEKSHYSKKRAEAVKAVFLKNGIENNRISIKTIGALEPVSKGDTEPDRAKNRRVEFFIVTD